MEVDQRDGTSTLPDEHEHEAEGQAMLQGAGSHLLNQPGPQFVYAVGNIEPRLPTLGLEKELVQATGRSETAGLTDRQTLRSVLSERSNRYLTRHVCWVLTIEGLETYILVPRNSGDLDLLVDSIRTSPSRMDLDVVIGVRGPIASPDACNGLMVPIVVFDQVYSFDRDSLIQALPLPETVAEDDEEQFRSSAEELFERVMQIADNAGATDEHRALNYLAVRYDRIYALAAEQNAENRTLSEVEVRPSPLSGTRRIVDVIYTFRHRQTDVIDRYFVRVDVTEEFPFLFTKISPYLER